VRGDPGRSKSAAGARSGPGWPVECSRATAWFEGVPAPADQPAGADQLGEELPVDAVDRCRAVLGGVHRGLADVRRPATGPPVPRPVPAWFSSAARELHPHDDIGAAAWTAAAGPCCSFAALPSRNTPRLVTKLSGPAPEAGPP